MERSSFGRLKPSVAPVATMFYYRHIRQLFRNSLSYSQNSLSLMSSSNFWSTVRGMLTDVMQTWHFEYFKLYTLFFNCVLRNACYKPDWICGMVIIHKSWTEHTGSLNQFSLIVNFALANPCPWDLNAIFPSLTMVRRTRRRGWMTGLLSICIPLLCLDFWTALAHQSRTRAWLAQLTRRLQQSHLTFARTLIAYHATRVTMKKHFRAISALVIKNISRKIMMRQRLRRYKARGLQRQRELALLMPDLTLMTTTSEQEKAHTLVSDVEPKSYNE